MEHGSVRIWSIVLLVLGAIALLWPSVAGAEELRDLRRELQTHKQRTAELENRINQLESRQENRDRALTEKNSRSS